MGIDISLSTAAIAGGAIPVLAAWIISALIQNGVEVTPAQARALQIIKSAVSCHTSTLAATIVKVPRGQVPEKADPDTIYQEVDELGRIISETYFGEEGTKEVRVDYDHPHGGMSPHRHYYWYDGKGFPHEIPTDYEGDSEWVPDPE
jgi:hypothetical protein